MQIRRFMTGATLATGIGVGAWPAAAQIGLRREPHMPDVYAITNARIITGVGPAIDRGTVVVRGGIVTAVGAGATTPPDAQVIDGTGLTVYPGFIDANSSFGLATGATASAAVAGGGATAGRGGRGAAAAQQGAAGAALNSLHPPGLQPELAAVDLVNPDAEAFAGPQSAGITAALTAPPTGIFRGLSAVVMLRSAGGATGRSIVIKAPVAEHIAFTPLRTGGYPNSLMGVFSVLRQMLLDAQHYALEQAAYARNPRGTRRPEPDPSLEALQPMLNRQVPVILEASSQREIERALDLAKEFNLRPIIAGGDEAEKVASRLKAAGVPVLLSLAFPRRPSASADADPEPLRMLRARVEAPRLASTLQAAGVTFAFEDGGLTNWGDFLGNVTRAVESGLTADQAVRALTLSPAEILGVADRLGTIEPGKIANLTIARGELFARGGGGRVTQLFVDGMPIDVRGAAAAGGASIAAGTWTITVMTDEGEKPVTLALQQVGDQLRGTIQGSLGTSQISNGSIGPDSEVRFSATVTMDAGTEDARFVGTVAGNLMRGTVQIVGHPQGTFVGTKPEGSRGGRPPRVGRSDAHVPFHARSVDYRIRWISERP